MYTEKIRVIMKKICTIVMTVLLLIPIAVSAESVQTGRFRYMPAFEEESEEVYYFSDDYFRTSGTEYNEHLLGMSYALALSTFEIRGAEYCQDLLEETGFSDIEVFDMKEKPTPDTLGMLIGRKKVDGRDLIAVAIRGEKYDSEWSSNLLAGKEGDATGFRQACAKALGRIKGYIDSYGLNDLKIWITGYSRAGAVADLAGVYLNEHLSEYIDVAFPVLHGYLGEDGAIQGFLKILDIPFVGPDILSSAACMDKEITKILLKSEKIPVADYITLRKPDVVQYEDISKKLGGIVFVKPASSGSSVGVSKVRNEAELIAAIAEAYKYDNKVLIEKAIVGREIECAVIGNENPQTSDICGEVIALDDFYTYEANILMKMEQRLKFLRSYRLN